MAEYTEDWERWVGSIARPLEHPKRGARITVRGHRRWITFTDTIDGAAVVVEMPDNAPTRQCDTGRHDDCCHRLGGPAEGGMLLRFGLPGFVWRCGCACHHDPHRAGRLF